MRSTSYFVAALIAALAFGGGQALANTCRAEKLSCPTSMPIGGYCECTFHGTTQGGEVAPPAPHEHYNSTPGGCGVNPSAPGCR